MLLPVSTFVRLLIAALRGASAQRRRQLARLWPGARVAAALLVLFFSPRMIAWRLIFGSFLTVPQGSTGIGAAAARAFARFGCKVGIHYNASRNRADEVAADVRLAGGQAHLVARRLHRHARRCAA